MNVIFRNTCLSACLLIAATPSAEAFSLQGKAFHPMTSASTSQLGATDNNNIEERFNSIKQAWQQSSFRVTDLKKTLTDEIYDIEKLVSDTMASADSVVKTIIETKGPMNMIQSMKAADAISEAVATTAAADANAVKDLGSAADNVAKSMNTAEKVIQAIFKDGKITKDAVASLESSASDITKSMETANSVAAAVSKVASKDAAAVTKLESAGQEIIKFAVSSTPPPPLDAVANSVVKEMNAAETVAKVVAANAVSDAKSVASLDSKAADAIQSIKNVESAVEKASGGDANAIASLKSVTGDSISQILSDEKVANAVAQAIAKDATADATAVEALRVVDAGVSDLIKSADAGVVSNLVKSAEEVTAAVTDSINAVSQSVDPAAAKEVIASVVGSFLL